MSGILFPEDTMSLEQVGGKAMSLYSLQDLPIPPWFVVLTNSLENDGDCEIDDKLKEEIKAAITRLTEDENCLFAVRSSAIDEDGAGFSFAGQFESYLGVKAVDVPDRIIDVWKSGFSDRIKAYRQENNLGNCIAPAAIVQKMVNADSAGVAFAVDPVQGHWDRAVVSSVWGLGSALVDGDADADVWQVTRKNKICQRQIAKKTIGRFLNDDKETEMEIEDEKASKPSLTDKQVCMVARLARQCSEHHGLPQDIEWAFETEQLYLLQSRPITSLANVSDPEGYRTIWDNSNIAESYGGVTTPLTYSFARSIYEEVYREFCKIMGVPKDTILHNAGTFRGLLGLFNGRMYYNLLNWYRLLAVFPGFSINRGFMEQMMGVQEELGEELLSLIEAPPKKGKIVSWILFSKSLLGMLKNHLTVKRQIARFYQRLNKALEEPDIPLTQQRPDELAAYYRSLEDQLLLKWDAPLVNDFFAMIFYGVLSKLCKKWCNDEDGTLQNDLVGGDGEVISAEPARRVKEMAKLIEDDQALCETFRNETKEKIISQIRQHKKLNDAYNDYLTTFGNRCLDELKLESTTLHDNPLPLLRAIGHFAGRTNTVSEDHALKSRQAAEQKVKETIKGALRKFIFNWVLKHARARVSNRENLRFERTRLFGRVRQIMVEIGKRFEAVGVLDKAEDVFYLEKDEILNYIDGYNSCPDMNAIAAVRKKHFTEYATMVPGADRFETRGMVFVGNDFSRQSQNIDQTLSVDERSGIGCCPGIVKGEVRVVRDPRGVELPSGCILVAERTDPGWIMLFPAASGLLVERGSLLSHSAIVARELGLPAIVAIQGVTSWLQNGDVVEFNGSTGTVKLIERADNSES